jgi:hypothetical protein
MTTINYLWNIFILNSNDFLSILIGFSLWIILIMLIVFSFFIMKHYFKNRKDVKE